MISANLNSIQYQLPFHPNLLESVIQFSPSFPICHFQVKQFKSNILQGNYNHGKRINTTFNTSISCNITLEIHFNCFLLGSRPRYILYCQGKEQRQKPKPKPKKMSK